MIGWKRKSWALYQRVSELLLSPKVRWRRMKWKLYAKAQHPEKWASSWEEGLSSLPESEWAAAESQSGMTQYFRSKKRKIENHHQILRIRIGLGSNFQLQQAISTFLEETCPKKEFFPSKIKKNEYQHWILHTRIGQVPNFSLNWQFWHFGPNLPKNGTPV